MWLVSQPKVVESIFSVSILSKIAVFCLFNVFALTKC